MRMQKEEKIVVVLLLMALGSLAVAFWAFGPEEGAAGGAAKEDALTAEGLVLEVKPTKSGGNLLLRLDSTPLSIFVPVSAGAGEVQGKIKPGDHVRIRGTVSEYQGTEELKVARAGDIQVLGS